MTVRRILAASTGFGRSADGSWTIDAFIRTALDVSAHPRSPRVAWLGTAKGDRPEEAARVRAAFDGSGVRLTPVDLLPQPNVPDLREVLLAQDVVYVGGGSVAGLLALWRVHGVDAILRDAWEAGVVLAGHSAGSLCWHVGGPTDSFGPQLRVVTDGLGLVPYGNGVHTGLGSSRLHLLQQAVSDGLLPISYATGDGAALLYEGTDLVDALAVSETAGVFRVEPFEAGARTTRIPARRIG